MNNLKLHKMIAKNSENIRGIEVVRGEQIRYIDSWNGFMPSDALNVMSVTKSIISLLIGIALDQKLIKSVDQKVLDFFPDYVIRRGERTVQKVTIKDLLTMTAPYKYRSEPWKKVCTSSDWTKAALDLLGGKQGISGKFKYSTLGIQILSGVLSRVSGLSVVEYANRVLFKPLGIPYHTNASVHNQKGQYEFLMSKEPKEAVWMADPQGSNTAGWGLCLSVQDMAKIGMLCLDKGIFAGHRVLSKQWVQALSAPYIRCDKHFGNMSYGYLWWIIDEKRAAYAAIGDGGNVIYVNPETNLVIAVTAIFKPRVFDRIKLIQEQIEPFFCNN